MTSDAGSFACVDPDFRHGGDHDFHDDDDGRGDHSH
jgi:feruloyl esterase